MEDAFGQCSEREIWMVQRTEVWVVHREEVWMVETAHSGGRGWAVTSLSTSWPGLPHQLAGAVTPWAAPLHG